MRMILLAALMVSFQARVLATDKQATKPNIVILLSTIWDMRILVRLGPQNKRHQIWIAWPKRG